MEIKKILKILISKKILKLITLKIILRIIFEKKNNQILKLIIQIKFKIKIN